MPSIEAFWMTRLQHEVSSDGGVNYDYVVHVYLFATTLLTSHYFLLFPSLFGSVVRTIVILSIFLGILYCAVKKWYSAVLIAVAAFVYGAILLIMFSNSAGTPINFNMGLTIYSFGGVAVLYPALRRDPNRLLNTVYWYAVFYTLSLVVIAIPAMSIMPNSDFVVPGRAHGESRLWLSYTLITLALAVGVENMLSGRGNRLSTLVVLIAVVGGVASGARIGPAIILSCCLLYFVLRNARISMRNTIYVFAAMTVVCFFAFSFLYILDFNPYAQAFGDISSLGRAQGFYLIRAVSEHSPLFGVGIAAGNYNWYGGNYAFKFYDSDYGVFGILVWGGLFAVSLYFVIMYLGYRFFGSLQRIGVRQNLAYGFALCAWMHTAYSVSAPVYLIDGGSMFASLIIAATVLAFEQGRVNRALFASGKVVAGGRMN